MKYLLVSQSSPLVFYSQPCTASSAQTAATAAPLRVAIAGMVHGHVEGFLQHSLHRPDIQIVGIFGARPASVCALRSAIQSRPQFDLYRSRRHAAEDASASRSGVHQYLRSSKSGGDMRPPWHPGHDGKAAGGQRRGCARHRGCRAQGQDPGAGELRDHRGIAAIMRPMTWSTTNPLATFARWSSTTAIRDRKKSMSAPSSWPGSTIPSSNGAGALYDFGCYGADLMTWLMDGQRPTIGDRCHAADQAGYLSASGRRGDHHSDLSQGAWRFCNLRGTGLSTGKIWKSMARPAT